MNRLESVPLCVKMAKVGAFTVGRDSGGGGLGKYNIKNINNIPFSEQQSPLNTPSEVLEKWHDQKPKS